MSRNKLVGLALVVLAVLVGGGVLVWRQTRPAPVEEVSVSGYLGGEKISLFEDSEFKQLAEA